MPIAVINPGESVKIEVSEDAKPVVSVKIAGSTKGGMKLTGHKKNRSVGLLLNLNWYK